jgi:NADPH-dependent 2,4-dienoyl-CoA reductase/sulfur reductase-like enzyme
MIHDVVILGAGPAGISCALELAQNGIHSLIIDENPAPGGQIYRGIEQNQSNQEITNWLGVDYQIGNKLISEAKDNHNIEWKLNVSLWDIRHEEQFCELGVLIEDRVQVIRARNVVLANGAMERPTPFKGWTLPGVMTIGAAQTALKQSGIIPKNGVVLAGQGPLFYLYAAQILEAGVKPRAVLDFSKPMGQANLLVQTYC